MRVQPCGQRKRATLAREQDVPGILRRMLYRVSFVHPRIAVREEAEHRRAQRERMSNTRGLRAVSSDHVDPVPVTA
jgi:hypothetical protein